MSVPEKTQSPDRTVPAEADATEVESAPKRKAMTEEQAREILDWAEGTGSEPVDDGIAEVLAMSPDETRELLSAGYSAQEVEEMQDAMADAPPEALVSREAMRAWLTSLRRAK